MTNLVQKAGRVSSALFALFLAWGVPAALPGVSGTATYFPATSPLGSGESRNWAGYVATGSGFTSVAGTWTVPALSGGKPGSSAAVWVGIGGVSSRDLIQAGIDETVGASGQARYDAWYELLPRASRPVSLTINAGDTVSVGITQPAAGSWQIQIADNTSGQSSTQTVSYQSSLSSAEWIVEAPTSGRRVLPLADFGTVSFSGATTVQNGTSETIAQAKGAAVTMAGARGQVEATPAPLGSDGESFSVAWSAGGSAASPGPGSGRGRFPFPGRRGGSPAWIGWGSRASSPWAFR